jgi:hypothetical protein
LQHLQDQENEAQVQSHGCCSAPAMLALVSLLVVPMAIMAMYTLYRYVDIGVEEPVLGCGTGSSS